MSTLSRRRRQLTSRVLLIFSLLWAVSTWTLILKSLPSPRTSPLHVQHNQQRRENARSLEAINDASSYSQLEDYLPAPATSLIYPLHAKKGTHHVYFYIGTPPQRQTLIVDTGSRLTAFPCQPNCRDCGVHASEQFYLEKSSSHEILPCSSCLLSNSNADHVLVSDGEGGLHESKPIPTSCYNDRCEIEQFYTEGSSWRAFEVKDKVWLGTNDEKSSVEEHESLGAPFVFGCQVSEKGLFKKQYADGIMGLSMYSQTLARAFNHHGSIPHESFSLCFNKVGGHMALAGTARNHSALMQFTPFATKHNWYYSVTVDSIYVGKHKLPGAFMQYLNDYKGTIVDSGTTDTFLPLKIAKPFIHAWEGISGRRYTNDLQLYTYEQFKRLPSITFLLEGGVMWEIEASNYMEDASDNTRISQSWHGKRGFISRLYVNEPKGAVLGSNAMINHNIYFDITNRRLGVAKASCI